MAGIVVVGLVGALGGMTSCAHGPASGAGQGDAAVTRAAGDVRPGITVLLEDSLHLVRGRRVGLLTNHTGVNERGVPDIDLLWSDPRATAAGVKLVALFAPEHGIRGTEDREDLTSGVDAKTGLVIHTLYRNGTIAPPDSTLRGVEVLVYDLPEVGTRTWTYVGNLVYALRAVKRNGLTLVVLDRPAPLTGTRRQGPLLDTAIADPQDPAPGRRGHAYALWPFPLRHGMTMGELARFYNEELGIGADLKVVPMRGWRRAMWFDETGLPWSNPSPSIVSLASALVYPSLVAFEASNVSVGRGTPHAFQQFGAPWMDAARVARALDERELAGVRFEPVQVTPVSPGDRKFDGQRTPFVRVVVTDRDRVDVGRLGAAILSVLARTHRDSLVIRDEAFDHRFGSRAAREAILAGQDPDEVIDRLVPGIVQFEQRARKYFLYR